MNVVLPILAQARYQPTALAVCVPGAPDPIISYGRLATMLNNVAHHARAVGLKRGDTVAISVGDSVLQLVLTLGLIGSGIVTISPGAFAIPAEVSIDAFLTDGATAPGGSRMIHVDRLWMIGDGKAPTIALDVHDHENIASIILTSGTTGEPKGVALSHFMLTRRVGAYTFAFGNRISQCSRMFVDVGIASSWGLQWIVWVLSRGGALFLRGTDAAETLQAFSLYQVQCMVASPAGLAEFLQFYEQSPSFDCPFEVILAGGSITWKSLADRARARMCSHLVTGYGATEISPVAAAPYDRISDIVSAVGYVAAGVVVQSVDDADRPLAPGETGIIRMRGEFCVDGYIGSPPGSKQTFRNGWFYPGDIGCVTADHTLVISGRQTAVLNIGGNKIGPESIEQVALGFSGVEQAGAFSVTNEFGNGEVWAAIVAPGDFDEAALHRHCQTKLEHVFVPRRFLRVTALPRNANGKLDRARLAELAGPAVARVK